MILQISIKHIHSSNKPLLFWLKFHSTHDPKTFVEASAHLYWDKSMNEEYHSLMENDTWDLVPLLKGRKLVSV
jgi:hypothetical protein